MKRLLIPLFLLNIIASCSTVENEIGNVTLRVTSATVPFNVTYDNQYGNDITEISNTNKWEKSFEITCEGSCTDYYQTLNADPGLQGNVGNWHPNYSPSLTQMKIWWNGNLLISYEGITEWESIYTYFP